MLTPPTNRLIISSSIQLFQFSHSAFSFFLFYSSSALLPTNWFAQYLVLRICLILKSKTPTLSLILRCIFSLSQIWAPIKAALIWIQYILPATLELKKPHKNTTLTCNFIFHNFCCLIISFILKYQIEKRKKISSNFINELQCSIIGRIIFSPVVYLQLQKNVLNDSRAKIIVEKVLM
jgi:hypothetical protein